MGTTVGAVYSAAAASLASSGAEILRCYKARLRELKSPLALRDEAWIKCRRQAESILADCVAALCGQATTPQVEVWRYSRIVGTDRVGQGIGVAESIRAVEVLWAAFEGAAWSAAAAEHQRRRSSVMLAIVLAFRSSAMSRLYAGALGYDAALAESRASIDDAAAFESHDTDPLSSTLSRREREVLAAVGNALSNAQIASELGLSPTTVKRHLQNIYAKLDARSRLDAVNKARRLMPALSTEPAPP